MIVVAVPIPKQIIYTYELNVLQTEAILDHYLQNKGSKDFYLLLLDIDGSREIRKKGILLRLEIIKQLQMFIENNLKLGKIHWYGNDEYLIILEHENHEEALNEANRVKTLISEYVLNVNEEVENVSFSGNVTVTGGLVRSDEAIDLIDLIRLARIRVANGKDNGKNIIEDTGSLDLTPFNYNITKSQQEQLQKLSTQRGRGVDFLLREAVDTLMAHYPQFHGHRSDREYKLPQNAFAYACSSTGKYVDTEE